MFFPGMEGGADLRRKRPDPPNRELRALGGEGEENLRAIWQAYRDTQATDDQYQVTGGDTSGITEMPPGPSHPYRLRGPLSSRGAKNADHHYHRPHAKPYDTPCIVYRGPPPLTGGTAKHIV